jgi:hypothetical protein
MNFKKLFLGAALVLSSLAGMAQTTKPQPKDKKPTPDKDIKLEQTYHKTDAYSEKDAKGRKVDVTVEENVLEGLKNPNLKVKGGAPNKTPITKTTTTIVKTPGPQMPNDKWKIFLKEHPNWKPKKKTVVDTVGYKAEPTPTPATIDTAKKAFVGTTLITKTVHDTTKVTDTVKVVIPVKPASRPGRIAAGFGEEKSIADFDFAKNKYTQFVYIEAQTPTFSAEGFGSWLSGYARVQFEKRGSYDMLNRCPEGCLIPGLINGHGKDKGFSARAAIQVGKEIKLGKKPKAPSVQIGLQGGAKYRSRDNLTAELTDQFTHNYLPADFKAQQTQTWFAALKADILVPLFQSKSKKTKLSLIGSAFIEKNGFEAVHPIAQSGKQPDYYGDHRTAIYNNKIANFSGGLNLTF